MMFRAAQFRLVQARSPDHVADQGIRFGQSPLRLKFPLSGGPLTFRLRPDAQRISPKATSPSSRPRASVKRQALNAKLRGPRRIPCSGSQIARRTDGVNAKSLSDAVAYPLSATPDGLREDRFTNVAAVRRCARIWCEFAGSLRSFAWALALPHCRGAVGKNRQKLPLSFVSLCSERLTGTAAEPYIGLLGAPPPRRVGASAKPLTVYTVTEHPAMLVAMFASPRRMR